MNKRWILWGSVAASSAAAVAMAPPEGANALIVQPARRTAVELNAPASPHQDVMQLAAVSRDGALDADKLKAELEALRAENAALRSGKPATPVNEYLSARARIDARAGRELFGGASKLPPPPPPLTARQIKEAEVAAAAEAARQAKVAEEAAEKAAAAAAAAVVPPPAPRAPKLPFTFVGLIDNGDDKPSVFLSRGNQLIVVEEGANLESNYRVEKIDATSVTLIYLPLSERQVITTESGS